ncbi:MAG: hypothetical protein HKO71_08720 [Pseudomonadales bacterium]|nr:hypothetical protein [Gammaproteobacteria bacterium]NNL57823.1 hypothetical protein [Pseudomonadales bacterium]
MNKCGIAKRITHSAIGRVALAATLLSTAVFASAENEPAPKLKPNAQASATLELRSTFKGNQEQPKVMYIVPWQAIEAPPASYRPVSSLIAENFQLVDREEFQRNVHFSDRIKQANRNEAERFNALVKESR